MEEGYFNHMRIKGLSPSTALKPYIWKYYLYEQADERLRRSFFRALPSGRVEMFLFFDDNRIVFLTNRQITVLSGFVAGIFELTHPMKVKVEVNGGQFNGMSVIFTHLGVNRILNVRLSQLTNRIIDFTDFWSGAYQWLRDNILSVQEDGLRVRNLNQFFQNQIGNYRGPVAKIYCILDSIEQMEGPLSVERLARELNISYKSLYRMFVDEVGLTPKMYLKILRFNQACRMLNNNPRVRWIELVHQCGYYDQSHFIHEFKTIMKQSPRQYLMSTGGSFYLNRPYVFG